MATKTEGGRAFASSAYAYVPDPDKPDTWKLRLQDMTGKVTKSQLGAAAAAFSPGGFRGQRVQLPAGAVAGAKAKIRAAYRRLGVKPQDIPKSVREAHRGRGTLPGTHRVTGCISLSESTGGDGDKGIAEAAIIAPGFNLSKTAFYPAQVLARDRAVFEGAKMFADHPSRDDAKQRPERSIRDWVGTLHDVRVDESGMVRGSPRIHAAWMRDMLHNLREADALAEMGVSINVAAKVRDTKVEGHKTRLVEALIKAQSVDFVTFPGAGGAVNMYESDEDDEDGEYSDNQEDQAMSEEEVRALIEKATAPLTEAITALKEALGTKDAEIAVVIAERDKLVKDNEDAATAADQAAQLATAQAAIAEAIDKSGLPDVSKARLKEAHKQDQAVDAIAAAIETETAYIAELKPAGKVKGLGDVTKPDGVVSLFESQKQRYVDEGFSTEKADQMARKFAGGQ